MVERAGGTGLTLKSDDRRCVRGEMHRQELQRYQASQPDIARLIDDAHSSSAQFFQDVVVGQSATDHGGSFRHWQDILP